MPGSPPDAKGVDRLARSPAMEREQAQLTVTIEAGSDPIAGHLALPDGESTPFEGYMELIAALERCSGKSRRRDPTQEEDEAGQR
ncbi:MAG: hypothetical protein ACRDL6_01935 [Solirubrobacterales bacterium]